MGRSCAAKKKIALIYDEDFMAAYEKAEELRGELDVSLYKKPKKMKSLLDRLQSGGFAGFAYADGEIRWF